VNQSEERHDVTRNLPLDNPTAQQSATRSNPTSFVEAPSVVRESFLTKPVLLRDHERILLLVDLTSARA